MKNASMAARFLSASMRTARVANLPGFQSVVCRNFFGNAFGRPHDRRPIELGGSKVSVEILVLLRIWRFLTAQRLALTWALPPIIPSLSAGERLRSCLLCVVGFASVYSQWALLYTPTGLRRNSPGMQRCPSAVSWMEPFRPWLPSAVAVGQQPRWTDGNRNSDWWSVSTARCSVTAFPAAICEGAASSEGEGNAGD